MDPDFWHARWESGELGFHQTEVSPLLREHWPRLGLDPAAPVFVPLCGKTVDLRWLRERGHPVIGVELSPIAVRDFFAEAGIEVEQQRRPPFTSSTGRGFELLCGDVFDLAPEHLAEVRGVYDRAALVALPRPMRERYAAHLIATLPREVSILLVTLDYDPAKMAGPPHPVGDDEVTALFGHGFEIEALWSSGEVAALPVLQQRGLDVWRETVFRLERR